MFKLTRDEVDGLVKCQIVTSRITRMFQGQSGGRRKFLILDGKTVYHIGESLKDAGKKCFGVTLMKDAGSDLMKKLVQCK